MCWVTAADEYSDGYAQRYKPRRVELRHSDAVTTLDVIDSPMIQTCGLSATRLG